ncbi:MAG: pyridoxal phosphate-dependent class II aminotransferase [Mediterranea sp.]|jgi:threonine-phosphate decarboxylase|nr:pyridoxal phosphate-dependent class II aminotransferase [Mediterranea sp.]
MIKGHGDDIYAYNRPITSNFSSNVCYGADLDGLNRHLCNRIRTITNYPEPEPYTLEKKLEAHHNLPNGTVCVTNGATEAIYLIAQTFRGANTTILIPTFNEYADACRIHGHQRTTIREPQHLPPHTQTAWICNPNNPTGTVWDKELLTTLIRSNPKTCFIIDQAYEHFTQKELLTPQEALNHHNLIQLHSMTKRYAIPGLRLGYATAQAGLIQRLRENRMPWSVNRLAIEAGLYITEHGITHTTDLQTLLAETQKLKKDLENTQAIDVWPTDTHYMLARLHRGQAKKLKNYLAEEHGTLIRDASTFEGLSQEYFRIATQSPQENKQLVKHINQWITL